MLNGPEGDTRTLQLNLRRPVSIIKLNAGGGIIYYREDTGIDEFSRSFYCTFGIDSEITESLLLSITGDYYKAPDYDYNIRGIFSIKYIF